MAETATKKYKEFKQLNLPKFEKEILRFWKENKIFEKSVTNRHGSQQFVFYEGPPSANGAPGIHHVLSRTIKDLFCRYKTMKGFQVERKGGWDTHGLPVELSVEKLLGITKDDIGKKISVEEYNAICRKEVMKFTSQWEELTDIMGYWVDMKKPYVTYENNYIETLWYILKTLHNKGLIYKGYTIQPYSPAAGTGLSSHELNMPGTYRPVKDTAIVAQFKVEKSDHPLINKIFAAAEGDVFFLAWTTTPWTLPSNTALSVGKNIVYSQINTFNRYTHQPITVILAQDRVSEYFDHEFETTEFGSYDLSGKTIPWQKRNEFQGSDLEGIKYEQLLPYAQPQNGIAFNVVVADFVTTGDGTGIVHTAPSFGSDDFKIARQKGLGSLTLVDKQGKFTDQVGELSGMFIKNYKDDPNWENPDVVIAKMLKEKNRAFLVEKFEHNYPHCWRTDKPLIYFPLDSWFIKTTAIKDRLIELNKTINWKPASTGEGRFAQWLENLVDWNLSRSRYWGTPLPIWRTNDGSEEICIGSVEELTKEFNKAQHAGLNLTTNNSQPTTHNSQPSTSNPLLTTPLDLHKPFVDEIILVSPSGRPMYREADLIDVWFDSGAMPFAQWHWPFENEEKIHDGSAFPADFIAEGVDQTRGWFFTLHVIAALVMDSVAYKNVVSNGLVLDKNGNKMSKRHGNTVNPFETIYKYGADATRWYMITNTQPWDNLKFDYDGIAEVQRRFFGTLYNTYSFFVLYANVDDFSYEESELPVDNRPELDRWILSLLNSLIKEVGDSYDDFEPTSAARSIDDFINDHLSNWYVRLSRRRFWKGEPSEDKLAAYQTLYTCLETIARLMAPVAPFMSEWLYRNLNEVTERHQVDSVHFSQFPDYKSALVDKDLEDRMQLAQDISSTILALRKKVVLPNGQTGIKVRQPLAKVMIPILNPIIKTQIQKVEEIIKSEVNVKEIEYITDAAGIVTKKIKPNFKSLGPKLGANMKAVASSIMTITQQQIAELEKSGILDIALPHHTVSLSLNDVEILTEDIPGWLVGNAGDITVALDITISGALKDEGNAREIVSRLQKLRKDMNLEITDRIMVAIATENELKTALINYKSYICGEILADDLQLREDLPQFTEVIINDIPVKVFIQKT